MFLNAKTPKLSLKTPKTSFMSGMKKSVSLVEFSTTPTVSVMKTKTGENASNNDGKEGLGAGGAGGADANNQTQGSEQANSRVNAALQQLSQQNENNNNNNQQNNQQDDDEGEDARACWSWSISDRVSASVSVRLLPLWCRHT